MIEQGSDAWKAMRCGKVTASRVADVAARTKSGWGASRANMMATIIAERLTGQPADSYTTGPMLWGIEKEPEARAAYEWYSGNDVELIDFTSHPEIEMAGASPDGLVSADGMAEFKCPNTATHIETLLTGKIADKYIKQMMWQMACAKRQWVDFGSFDPRMPEEHRLWVKRVERDDKLIASLEADVIEFLAEVDEKIKKLNERLQEAA